MSVAVRSGRCHLLLAYDVGRWIDLEAARKKLAALQASAGPEQGPRASFRFKPLPLRLREPIDPPRLECVALHPVLEFVVFDFGAVSLGYSFDLEGPLEDLVATAGAAVGAPALLADARSRVESFVRRIEAEIDGLSLAHPVEDYAIFHVRELDPPLSPAQLLAEHAGVLARVLRVESAALSADEVADATATRISFGPDDVTLIDWNAALVYDREVGETRDVLEFTNVQLLELRFLDEELDRVLERAYDALVARGRFFPWRKDPDLRRVGRMQVDAAILFERVNNAVKLLGDQFLARLYRLASARMYLPQWSGTILRKLDTIESVYRKNFDQNSTRRLELLEWLIIALIALSMLL